MLFLDSHMLSDNICDFEGGVMYSVLRNASQSNTRLDKFFVPINIVSQCQRPCAHQQGTEPGLLFTSQCDW